MYSGYWRINPSVSAVEKMSENQGKTVAFSLISVTMFKDNLIMRDYYEYER